MLALAIVLTVGYIGYLVWEKMTNDKALDSFKYIIHINGIRGKTSVCRLIDAHLRGAGYKVFTKTTGTTPFYIDTFGKEHEIHRKSPANIVEQLRMIRRAFQEGAEVLIMECMAVAPELQLTAQRDMVKGRLNVITNVRYDHIFEMGSSLDEIAESLANTTPAGGALFTADENYYDFFREKCSAVGSEAILCRKGEYAKNENEAIACALGEYIGIPVCTFAEHAVNYREDFGAHKLYDKNGIKFLNLFSVNDPQSTKNILEDYFKDTTGVTFIYNNRADRPDRLLLFIKYFFSDIACKKVIVIGESRGLVKRMLHKQGCQNVGTALSWRDALDGADSHSIVGIGNIKGQACDMIEYFEEEISHE